MAIHKDRINSGKQLSDSEKQKIKMVQEVQKEISKGNKKYSVGYKDTKENSNPRVEQWLEFSMNPQTEESIRHKLLYDRELVCVSYVCRHSKLSEDFIVELMGLTTEFFDYENYDINQVLIVSKLISDYTIDERWKIIEAVLYNTESGKIIVESDRYKKSEDIRKNKSKEKLLPILEDYDKIFDSLDFKLILKMYHEKNIKDKVDWIYIDKYQDLSLEFRRRYNNLISKAKLITNDNYIFDNDTTN